MEKRKIFIGILFLTFLGLVIFGMARMRYHERVQDVLFEGTILAYMDKGVEYTPIILNPSDSTDYVEISFDGIKKQYQMRRVWDFTLDEDGIYLLMGNGEEPEDRVRILFISFMGTRYISESFPCDKPVYSSIITNGKSVIFNSGENVYKFDKSTGDRILIGKVKNYNYGLFPYLNGIIGQNGQNIEYLTENHREILGTLPKGMNLNGWYDVGERILTYQNKRTYILNIKTGEYQQFHGSPLKNYGLYKNTMLLYMLPRGGGGATPLDWELSDSWFLGNNVFEIYRMGLFDKETGYIVNLSPSIKGGKKVLLPVTYDRNKFKKLRDILNEYIIN